MKIFANLNFLKKILVILTLFTSMAVVVPKPVQASIGGELMSPICDVLVGIGDGVINILHKYTVKQQITMIRVSTQDNILETIFKIAAVILAVVAAIALACTLVGGIGVALTAISSAIAGTGAASRNYSRRRSSRYYWKKYWYSCCFICSRWNLFCKFNIRLGWMV